MLTVKEMALPGLTTEEGRCRRTRSLGPRCGGGVGDSAPRVGGHWGALLPPRFMLQRVGDYSDHGDRVAITAIFKYLITIHIFSIFCDVIQWRDQQKKNVIFTLRHVIFFNDVIFRRTGATFKK